jgi:hypothetical protein
VSGFTHGTSQKPPGTDQRGRILEVRESPTAIYGAREGSRLPDPGSVTFQDGVEVTADQKSAA